MTEHPLLEDAEGAPYPEEVQAAHRMALDEAVADALAEGIRRGRAAAAIRLVMGEEGRDAAARIEAEGTGAPVSLAPAPQEDLYQRLSEPADPDHPHRADAGPGWLLGGAL